MNRAFVKEPDGDQVPIDLPELTHSEHPNYITPAGYETLKTRIASLEIEAELLKQEQSIDAKSRLAYAQRDLRYLNERLSRAIVASPDAESKTVKFGSVVVLVDAEGNEYAFVLVGEDETDVDKGRISWASPLAQTLKGKAEGDEVIWQKGNQKLAVEVLSVKTE